MISCIKYLIAYFCENVEIFSRDNPDNNIVITADVHERHEKSHEREKSAARQDEKRRGRQYGKVEHGRQGVHGRLIILFNVFFERVVFGGGFVVFFVHFVPGGYSSHRHCVIQRAHLEMNVYKK